MATKVNQDPKKRTSAATNLIGELTTTLKEKRWIGRLLARSAPRSLLGRIENKIANLSA